MPFKFLNEVPNHSRLIVATKLLQKHFSWKFTALLSSVKVLRIALPTSCCVDQCFSHKEPNGYCWQREPVTEAWRIQPRHYRDCRQTPSVTFTLTSRYHESKMYHGSKMYRGIMGVNAIFHFEIFPCKISFVEPDDISRGVLTKQSSLSSGFRKWKHKLWCSNTLAPFYVIHLVTHNTVCRKAASNLKKRNHRLYYLAVQY